jgi:hypothetical protein
LAGVGYDKSNIALVACGIPLWRVAVFVNTLHPQIIGRRFICASLLGPRATAYRERLLAIAAICSCWFLPGIASYQWGRVLNASRRTSGDFDGSTATR